MASPPIPIPGTTPEDCTVIFMIGIPRRSSSPAVLGAAATTKNDRVHFGRSVEVREYIPERPAGVELSSPLGACTDLQFEMEL